MLLAQRIAALRDNPAFADLNRSLEIYYGDPARDAAMDRLYARFLSAGELAFDIGSHVGDRVGSFRRLGARVVALEPQPLCAEAIRAIYAGDPAVSVVEAACAARPGQVMLRINSANPTVSTASAEFVAAAAGAGGWEDQHWDCEVEVPATSLDALIGRHGAPAFAKIDVEGFEDVVLEGLSRPLPALSFEFTTIQREVAYRCLERLDWLGGYGCNVALGESQSLTFDGWLSPAEMAAHIAALTHEANSGDVYCVLHG
jgi:FkbM family methyltransferase